MTQAAKRETNGAPERSRKEEQRDTSLFEHVSATADRRLRRVPRLTVEALRFVWAANRRHLVTILSLQLVAALGVAAQLLIVRLVLVDLLASSDGVSASDVAPEFALLVAVTGGMGAISAFVAHEQRLLSEYVGRLAFDRIVGVSTAVDLRSLETPSFYDTLERARASALHRTIAMVNGLTSFTTAVLTSIGIAGVLLFLEPLLLGLVVLAAVPVVVATIHNSRERYAFEYALTPEARERFYLMELLTGRPAAKELRVFDSGFFLRDRYTALTEERLRRVRAFLRRRLVVSLAGTVASALGMGIAFGALVFLMAEDRIGVATAVTAAVAMQQLSARFNTLTASAGTLLESAMFIDDYRAFMDLAPAPEPRDSNARPASPPRDVGSFESLVVDGVSFTYPGRQTRALSDVSLDVRAGEVVALVGENGSGKTTLVKLVCQLYEPDAGRILWNGVDATTLSPRVIRDHVTVLFQDYIQYHLSALDNIALGRIEAPRDLEGITAAAMQAGADDFVSRLPSRYDTRLGLQFYGGYELSVGQWQRLALARAFFRGGNFLILDEPTASLDPRAEHDLFQQIRRLSAGKSVLLVSHRFSSVRSADRIYVLESGRVTENGSHDELIARDGHYAELFNLQAAAYLGERPS